MKLKKPLALLLFAVLLTFAVFLHPEARAQSHEFAAAGQRKTKAPAKKQAAANAEGTASETTAQGSEDADVERITVDELKAKIAKNEPITILDDRSEGSYESSETQIKGSIRITVDEIQSRSKEIPRDREIVTYCT